MHHCSNRRGSESEAFFVLEAFKRGWEVCKPYSNAEPYDFTIRRAPGGPWETVQVKTAHTVAGQLRVKLQRGAGIKRAYERGDFDLLFVVAGGDCWLLPWSAVAHIRCNFRLAGFSQFALDPIPSFRSS